MKSLLLLLTIFIFCISCNNSKIEKEKISPRQLTYVRGKLLNASGSFVYLQKLSSEKFITIDTIIINENGDFEANMKVEQPGFYAIRNEVGNAIIFTAMGGDTVGISADYFDFTTYDLSGSYDLEELEKLNIETKKFLAVIDELSAMSRDSANSSNYTVIKLEIDRQYKNAYNQLREFSFDFIKNNKNSLVSLIALTNKLGPDFYVFHPIKDMELFLETDSILYSRFPDNEPVASLHSEMQILKNQQNSIADATKGLRINDQAPEIELNSPDGKKIKLSSTRGKYVLLDFWASWCPPCRRENPNLVENYKKYKSEGFEIFQVSLDKTFEEWTRAIKEDHLDWIHVSDLKYWDSEVVSVYNINGIPFNYLIDPDGKIIASNLRDSLLTAKLENIFNK